MSHVSDSDHRRLEAKVFPDYCVVESHEISDVSRGLRRVPVTRVWRKERLLGRGGFGEVLLQYQEGEKDAKRALKIIRTKGIKLSLADCQRELTAMIEFTKPKYKDAAVFVDFIGWFQTDDAMFLAMEYMPLGDLEHNVLEIESSPTHTGPPLSEEEVQEISRQILEGLKIMHAEGFAHRDLKPQNVFVAQKEPQWWVKLGDFGLSKKETDGTAFRTQAGTQQYMAPEMFYFVEELDTESSEYTNAIDLWSLGCIIHRVVTGAVPFPSPRFLRNYCKDPSKVPLNMPSNMEEAGKFVGSLLMVHPANRPTASAALELPWLTIKNKPKITLSNLGAGFAALNVSESQNNYNTASHKGLRSYLTLPATNIPPLSPVTNENASEPLPSLTSEIPSETFRADARSNLHDENKKSEYNIFNSELGLPVSYGIVHRSASQPTQSTNANLPKEISDETQFKPQKQISVHAQQGRGQRQPTNKEDILGFILPVPSSEPGNLTLSSTEPYSGPAEGRDATTQMNLFVIDPTSDRSGQRTRHETLSNDLVNELPIWDDHRPTQSDTHMKPRTDPVLLPQRTTNTLLPLSKPTSLRRETYPIILPEGRQEKNVGLPHGRAGGWEHNITINDTEKHGILNEPANLDEAVNNTQVQRPSSAVPERTNFWMKALWDFDPQRAGDLRFSKGDIIRVTDNATGPIHPQRWLVGEINGRKGIFPSNYCMRVVWMKALYEFDPQYQGDLRLSAGDLIRITDVSPDRTVPVGWLVGEVNGRSGMFPANYCELVPAAPGPENYNQTSPVATDNDEAILQRPFMTPEDQRRYTSLFNQLGRRLPVSE